MTGIVWIVDDDSSIRFVLDRALSAEGWTCRTFSDGESVLKAIEEEEPEAIISDIRMPGIDGLEMLQEIHKRHHDVPVIITTAHSDLSSAVNSYQSGSFEYLPKPFDIDEAISIVKKAIAQHQEKKIDIEKNSDEESEIKNMEILGESPAMQEVFRAIGRLSRSSISVLINGQSGTGKELVAHHLHEKSDRSVKPLVEVNCAAIPAELIESELFGHEKGAFTSAIKQRKGKFEQADGGTLFLDEVGDMSHSAQAKVLRALQENIITRVGSDKPVDVNVRVIAATNKDLQEEIKHGNFREDLYHRLSVILIHVPALDQRKEDIPLLASHFVRNICNEYGQPVKEIETEALEELMKRSWTGNIREFRNVIERLIILSNKTITLSDIKLYVGDGF